MAFLAPFVPALIGAGSSIGSALLGKKGSSSGSGQFNDQIAQLLGDLKDTGSYAKNMGGKFLKRANKSFKLPMNYWKKLLKGDRTEMASALAPEIDSIHGGYDAIRKNVAEFGPRGGGKTSALVGMEGQEQGDINRLLQTMRPQAAQNLAQIGAASGSIGGGLVGTAASAAGQGISGLLGQSQLAQQERGQNQSMWSGIGRGVGSILGGLFNKEGGSSSGGGGGTISKYQYPGGS